MLTHKLKVEVGTSETVGTSRLKYIPTSLQIIASIELIDSINGYNPGIYMLSYFVSA